MSTVSKSKVTNLKIPVGGGGGGESFCLYFFWNSRKEISVAICFMLQFTNTVMDEMHVKEPRD